MRVWVGVHGCVLVCVCVCIREKEKERGGESERTVLSKFVCTTGERTLYYSTWSSRFLDHPVLVL